MKISISECSGTRRFLPLNLNASMIAGTKGEESSPAPSRSVYSRSPNWLTNWVQPYSTSIAVSAVAIRPANLIARSAPGTISRATVAWLSFSNWAAVASMGGNDVPPLQMWRLVPVKSGGPAGVGDAVAGAAVGAGVAGGAVGAGVAGGAVGAGVAGAAVGAVVAAGVALHAARNAAALPTAPA